MYPALAQICVLPVLLAPFCSTGGGPDIWQGLTSGCCTQQAGVGEAVRASRSRGVTERGCVGVSTVRSCENQGTGAGGLLVTVAVTLPGAAP